MIFFPQCVVGVKTDIDGQGNPIQPYTINFGPHISTQPDKHAINNIVLKVIQVKEENHWATFSNALENLLSTQLKKVNISKPDLLKISDTEEAAAVKEEQKLKAQYDAEIIKSDEKKKSDATNENITGLIELKDNQISKIGVLAKVADFKSGNSSLDSNSFRVLDALKIPNIIFRSTEIIETSDVISVYGTISFHGIEKAINVTLNKSNDNDIVSLNGKFIIKLSDFNVKRPSLLLQKINDEIEVQINLISN